VFLQLVDNEACFISRTNCIHGSISASDEGFPWKFTQVILRASPTNNICSAAIGK